MKNTFVYQSSKLKKNIYIFDIESKHKLLKNLLHLLTVSTLGECCMSREPSS